MSVRMAVQVIMLKSKVTKAPMKLNLQWNLSATATQESGELGHHGGLDR